MIHNALSWSEEHIVWACTRSIEHVLKLLELGMFYGKDNVIIVAIIIFSLLLKILPLPLDIYSKTATKKNALKMEKMRPELEKLQKHNTFFFSDSEKRA